MHITCPKCHASLDGEAPVGTSVICPACNSVFAVGDTSPEPPPVQSHTPQSPVMKPVAKYNESKEPKKSDTERFLPAIAYLFSILSLGCIGGIIVSLANDDKTGPVFFGAFVACIASSLLLHAVCNLLKYQRIQIGLLHEISASLKKND